MPKKKGPSLRTGRTRSEKIRPTQDEIALRAYHIYLERGGAAGNELEDWTRAERELLEKNGKSRPKAASKSIAA